jgi:hypothetical protein
LKLRYFMAWMAALGASWLPQGALADQNASTLGSAAAPWLKIPTSVRSEGMAEASVAQTGVDDVALNPAALDGIGGQDIAVGHNSWVQGTSLENLVYGARLSKGTVLGLDLSYFNVGSVNAYAVNPLTNQLSANGSLNPFGSSAGLALAQELRWGLSAGAALKVVDESLDGKTSSQAYTADLGMRWASGPWSAGIAALNCVGDIEGASLPGNLAAGLAWATRLDRDTLHVEADFQAPFVDPSSSSLGLGGEYWWHDAFAFRLGYKAGDAQAAGSMSGVSAGLGGRVGPAELNYAFISLGDLGSSNQIQLILRFGGTQQGTTSSPEPDGSKPPLDGKSAPQTNPRQRSQAPASLTGTPMPLQQAVPTPVPAAGLVPGQPMPQPSPAMAPPAQPQQAPQGVVQGNAPIQQAQPTPSQPGMPIPSSQAPPTPVAASPVPAATSPAPASPTAKP